VNFDNFALTKTAVTTKVQNVESITSKIYPNPFKDNLTVESAETMKNISIYSVNGQRIKDLTVNSTKANIGTSNFSKGIYMLKIETANGVKTMSIVK
jgi:peptidoglycan hydrolase-like protein with peptidoglycan-binding domain